MDFAVKIAVEIFLSMSMNVLPSKWKIMLVLRKLIRNFPKQKFFEHKINARMKTAKTSGLILTRLTETAHLWQVHVCRGQCGTAGTCCCFSCFGLRWKRDGLRVLLLLFFYLFFPNVVRTKANFLLIVDTKENHLLLKRGGLGHEGAVDQEEQNKEGEECRQQRHQMVGGLYKIHLGRSRDRCTFVWLELEKQQIEWDCLQFLPVAGGQG